MSAMSERGPQDVFPDLARTPLTHFALVLTAAILRIVGNLMRQVDGNGHEVEHVFSDFPVLREYYAIASDRFPEELNWSEYELWWDRRVLEWENGVQEHLPLRDLGQRAGMGLEAGIAAVLAGAVESDVRLGALIAQLQNTPVSSRPTVSLLESVTSLNGAEESVPRNLLAGGWLRAEDEGDVKALRHVRLPYGLWDVLRGYPPVFDDGEVPPPRFGPRLKELILPLVVRDQVLALPRLIRREVPSAVIVRGPDGSGRTDLIAGAARVLRRSVLCMDMGDVDAATGRTPLPPMWDELGPLCTLGRIIPVLKVDAAPGQSITVPTIPAYEGPVGIVLNRHGGVVGPAVERAVFVDLPYAEPDQRAQIWAQALEGVAAPAPEELGSALRMTGGHIRRVALQARRIAQMAGVDTVDFVHIRDAARALNRHVLEPLAQRVDPWGSWDEIFVTEATRDELSELQGRCRHREALLGLAGPALRGTLTRGVRALFNGPTGTGKTLAARILAAELHMDLYRVDLATVVDKYVGETEKRLDKLLSRAEELDVILLLDEGDALLTGRTDVRSANDRYANLETNFLLQRLESYEGIFLVTTNAGSRIDNAFQRRFDAVIDFPPPGARERLGIWATHLPAERVVNDETLRAIARRVTLAGGQIRNAALFATLLSAEAGLPGLVTAEQVQRAVQREYRKAGAAFPQAGGDGAEGARAAPRRVDELLKDLGA